MRILVLDDDAEYGQMIADFLQREIPEYVTLAVATADGARAAARDADQPYDVLLIDQRLDAGQDGIELMQELRAQSPDTDAIIFTALNDSDSGLRAYHAGAYQYLPKPINTREPAVDSTLPARGAHGGARTALAAYAYGNCGGRAAGSERNGRGGHPDPGRLAARL